MDIALILDFLHVRAAGTSSGFGRRLVVSAVARGDRVIATARSTGKVHEFVATLKPDVRERIKIAQLDVTDGEDEIKKKVDAMALLWGGIDVLVNNAGALIIGLSVASLILSAIR